MVDGDGVAVVEIGFGDVVVAAELEPLDDWLVVVVSDESQVGSVGVPAERERLRGDAMLGVPDVNTSPADKTVGGDQPAGEADLDVDAVDFSADLDLVAQRFRGNRVTVRVDRHERQHVVHPTHLDVVRIEPHPRQRAKEIMFDSETGGRWLAGGA